MIRTDEDIKRDLVEELYWDYRVDASNVKAEVVKGRVVLSGTVPSKQAREAATSAAWDVNGVNGVNNCIAVILPPEEADLSDEEILSNAERSLAWSPDLYTLNIQVSVQDGVVRLDGSVDNYGKLWKAEERVSDARGVVEVENHLTVVPGTSYQDEEIARNIESAMERNKFIEAENVIVHVEDGKVTMTGRLPSYYARSKAYQAAAFTPGVLDIENGILVA